MKVFITGTTGYIGFAVARAFRRAGHEVWGLCRSAPKGHLLAREEVHPVQGDVTQPESFRAVADDCAVLVHAASDMKGGVVGPDRSAIDAFLAAARRGARPKTVVYTSGVWVYGSTGPRSVDETAPLSPARLMAWRPAHEQLVLGSTEARGIVIRPGCVYGGSGGLASLWFDSASREGAARAIGDGTNRWAMVHVEDLADAYVRAAESGLSGEVFNVTDRSRSTVAELAAAAARAAGHPGKVRYVPLADAAASMGDLAECLALDQHADARKAVRRLGWQPRHGGFADGVEAYFEAWKAHQG